LTRSRDAPPASVSALGVPTTGGAALPVLGRFVVGPQVASVCTSPPHGA
jgi:hypothetical protein